jgi:hypothetical protein
LKVCRVPLQQVALLLTHAHLRSTILAEKAAQALMHPVMGVVQLHCNPL